MWLFFALGSAFFAGLTAILAKIGVKDVSSNLGTAIRTIVILFFSWLMVFLTGAQGGLSSLSAQTLLFLILSGLATGMSWLCYFKALQLGNVNKVTPIDKSSTILTILLSFLFLGEHLTAIKIAAMVLIAAGTFLMIEKKKDSRQSEDSKWLVFALGSALFASLTSILGKVGIQDVNSNLGTAIRTLVVLVMAWLVVGVTGEFSGIRKVSKTSWKFLVLSGLTTGMSWLCYYRALQDGPVSVVAPIDKMSILLTIAFSCLILHESVSKKALLGLAGVTAGTLLLLF